MLWSKCSSLHCYLGYCALTHRALENDPLLRALTGLNQKAFDLERGQTNRWGHRLQRILERALGNIPDEVAVVGDLRFHGLQKEFVNIHLPRKKLRGKELSEEQKQESKEFSSQRVVCKHAHISIKRDNAVSAIYRNRVPNFDDHFMLTATGLK